MAKTKLSDQAYANLMKRDAAARAMLAALEAALHLVEKADADSGCIAFMERAQKHRAAIAQANAAGIVI